MKFKEKSLASMLNRKAELWRNAKSETKNRAGQYQNEPKKLCTLHVACIPQSYGLLNVRSADTTIARTTHKIVMRYRTDIKASDWFVIDGKKYNILAIQDPYLVRERLECFVEQLEL